MVISSLCGLFLVGVIIHSSGNPRMYLGFPTIYTSNRWPKYSGFFYLCFICVKDIFCGKIISNVCIRDDWRWIDKFPFLINLLWNYNICSFIICCSMKNIRVWKRKNIQHVCFHHRMRTMLSLKYITWVSL